jgi:PPOX class probable F420-dependent enzyme
VKGVAVPPLSRADAEAFLRERHWGVLVTLKSSDGRPQLSNVGYALLDGRIRVSVTADRAKTANVRRDPRVSLYVTSKDFWTYVVAEGRAELSPVAAEPGDETCRALLELLEVINGKPTASRIPTRRSSSGRWSATADSSSPSRSSTCTRRASLPLGGMGECRRHAVWSSRSSRSCAWWLAARSDTSCSRARPCSTRCT